MFIFAYQASDLDLEKLSAIYCTDSDFVRSAFCYNAFDYFSEHIGGYAVLEKSGNYVCAMRFEPYMDGILISCLQTKPDCRRRGYAQNLIGALQAEFSKPIYSHVAKNNHPSLCLHRKMGFDVISDTARLLDGTVTSRYLSMCLKNKNV